jgi:hypothetical protein
MNLHRSLWQACSKRWKACDEVKRVELGIELGKGVVAEIEPFKGAGGETEPDKGAGVEIELGKGAEADAGGGVGRDEGCDEARAEGTAF